MNAKEEYDAERSRLRNLEAEHTWRESVKSEPRIEHVPEPFETDRSFASIISKFQKQPRSPGKNGLVKLGR